MSRTGSFLFIFAIRTSPIMRENKGGVYHGFEEIHRNFNHFRQIESRVQHRA